MDSHTKQMILNMALLTETKGEFIDKMSNTFISQFTQSITTVERVHVLINALFFIMHTKYDWIKHEKFTRIVQEKTDELTQHVNLKCPELKNITEDLQHLYDQRIGLFKCKAITLKGLNCKRVINPFTSVFTHFCAQHKKLVKEKFAIIILSLDSLSIIKDLSSTIARIVVELMKK